MVNVSIFKIFYSVLIFMKCKRSVDLVVQSSNKFVVIRNSSIFVDKTVLLKKIFQYDFLLITAPHKFGKTTNLHMIKLFLGNGNPKTVVADVFRNTNIWRDREFIVKHVCNHPIIHCNMKAKEVIQTFDDLNKILKKSVSDAFLEHKYLLQSTKLGIATKKRYIEYCKSQVNGYEVGLKFLSKILHMHHGKRVTVLIDDFDYALTYSIFKKELDSTKTAEVLFRFIDNTINLNEYVEKSVVMGCIPFKLGAQYSGLYLLEHFRFMTTKDFTPYFGFTQRETNALLDKFKLGNFKKDISKWYGGYTYLYSDFQIYNPWSVLMFLKHKKLDIYWVARSSQRMLYNYIEPNYELKEHLTNLVKNKNVTIEAVSSFTSYEVDKLKSVQFASYSYAEDYTEDHLFLQLLLESGYLTYAQKYRTVPISTKIKIPNMEIQKVFKQILLRLAAVYPDINRRYRAAHPTRYYKHHREPVQSPQQDARKRTYSNQDRVHGRWQQQSQYSESESFIKQYGTRRASYPYRESSKAVRPTYSKYKDAQSAFRQRLPAKRVGKSEESQKSSDNSRIYRRPTQKPKTKNTIYKRQYRENKEGFSQESVSQSDSFISDSRMNSNEATRISPNKYRTQQHNPQRQVYSSESDDSKSGSFFANYRAHLRAGKIKATPDLIFNPQYKTERESSSLDLQESLSDSFTYNYKTFEEAERLISSVTVLPTRQKKNQKETCSQSQSSQCDLTSHHHKTSEQIIQLKNLMTCTQQSKAKKESQSLESRSSLSDFISRRYKISKETVQSKYLKTFTQQPTKQNEPLSIEKQGSQNNLTSRHHNTLKEISQPKESMVSNTLPNNSTKPIQQLKTLKEALSVESQSLQKGFLSPDKIRNKENTHLKSLSSSQESKESVSTDSQDSKDSSLNYDSMTYKDESDLHPVQMYTTRKVSSPDSLMDCFAHQPSRNYQLVLTTNLPKMSSSHPTTSKIDITTHVHSTAVAQTFSTSTSFKTSSDMPLIHQSITNSPRIINGTDNFTNSYYNNIV